jgi:hypothetical protein
LLQDIIRYKKCDAGHAKKILDKIKGLGLGFFRNQHVLDGGTSYDLLGFAEARNIIPSEKLQQIYSKIEQRQDKQRQEIAEMQRQDEELEKKVLEEFTAKYGPTSGWSEWVLRQYNHRLADGNDEQA